MSRKRRNRAVARRSASQAKRMADELSLARARLGLSRLRVAERAGVTRSTVERIEAGEPSAQLDTLVAVLDAVGLDLVLQAYPGRTISLRDRGQMEIADHLRVTAGSSWHPRLEVAAGEFGRSADLVFYGAEEILHVEIERTIVDFQAQLRSAVRKREALAAIDRRPVRLVLAIEDRRRNRASLAPHLSLIRGQLPASTRDVMRVLSSGEVLGRDALVWVRRRPSFLRPRRQPPPTAPLAR